ncbi:MAG: hypothetical protein AAF573_05160 [Bacteroidota bacterium]
MTNFKNVILLLSLVFVTILWNCQKQISINNIDDIPPVSAEDEKFADVYKKLDGKWKGEFMVMKDPNPSPKSNYDLKNLKKDYVTRPELTLSNTIQVDQTYESTTPYFQKVRISDHYPDEKKTVASEGVNKVQNGKMWCVVRKPDETIIHEGSTQNDSTIVWQSRQEKPQKIEYFQETVTDEYYEIIGYGYYEGHDLNLSPEYWYYGKYARIKDTGASSK